MKNPLKSKFAQVIWPYMLFLGLLLMWVGVHMEEKKQARETIPAKLLVPSTLIQLDTTVYIKRHSTRTRRSVP